MKSLTRLLLAAGLLAFSSPGAKAQTDVSQCKRKTAGFYLQYADISVPKLAPVSGPGIAVSLTGKPGDPQRGREILSDKKRGDCLSCHKLATLSVPKQGEVGPELDAVGRRYSEAQLRQILVNPKTYFAQTIMPSYYRPEPGTAGTLLSAAEVEDLVAFMKNLK
jgi:sulfur-oxidizing protein SoxX